MRPHLLIAGLATLTAGCAYLTAPGEHPVIEQHAQKRVNTFAVVPARRMMIVKADRADDPTSPLVLCAEPPADVTDNIAATFAASLAASAKAGEASAGMTRTLETFGQILFKRSQGVQLFRDRSFYLCQARMNGYINDAQFQKALDDTFTAVIPLIETEVSITAPQAARPNAAATKANLPASAASGAARSAPRVSTTAGSASVIIEDGRITATVPSRAASAAKPSD